MTKDAAGEWRDANGFLIETAERVEMKERDASKATLEALFVELADRKKLLDKELKSYNEHMTKSSDDATATMNEIYPEIAKRRRNSVLSDKPLGDLGLDVAFDSIVSPNALDAQIDAILSKEAELMHAVDLAHDEAQRQAELAEDAARLSSYLSLWVREREDL